VATLRQARKPELPEVKVLKRKDYTPDLWIVWIEKPEGFTFKPGQYCTIGSDGIERAYSIVSSPHEPALELFVELVPPPDGVLTPKLHELHAGDKVTIRPRAKGLFTFKPDSVNHLLVATVTGIVPYINFLRDYLHNEREGHRFYVLQGASYVEEFVYDEEMYRLSSESPEFITYVPTVSRPAEPRNKSWSGETGRVNLIVDKYVEKFALAPEDTVIYACGHPAMIEEVKEKMTPRGFQVEEERYWKED